MNETRRRIGPAQAGVVLLALATAGIHLYLFLIEGFLGNGQMLPIYQLLFVGNFLAYVVLAAALYLPLSALASFRSSARVLLISVSVASIASYLHVGVFDLLGHLTKAIEVLIVALVTADAGLAGRGFGGTALQLAGGIALGIVLFLILRPVMG